MTRLLVSGMRVFRGLTKNVRRRMGAYASACQVISWLTSVLFSLPVFVALWHFQHREYVGNDADDPAEIFVPGLGPKYPSWDYLLATRKRVYKHLSSTHQAEVFASVEAFKDAPFKPSAAN